MDDTAIVNYQQSFDLLPTATPFELLCFPVGIGQGFFLRQILEISLHKRQEPISSLAMRQLPRSRIMHLVFRIGLFQKRYCLLFIGIPQQVQHTETEVGVSLETGLRGKQVSNSLPLKQLFVLTRQKTYHSIDFNPLRT